MSRPNPFTLIAFCAALVAALGGVALLKGGLYVAKHEGDTLHLLQIVFRMAAGEWPHIDFMTPIGILAFWPISVLVQGGLAVGEAILWAQIAVALGVFVPVIWTAWTRFTDALAFLFIAVVMVLILALVHGQSDQLVSISMHYNRWAWAVSYIVLVLALVPSKRHDLAGLDGLFIGLGMAALALTKVTYFVAFAPVVVAALVLRQTWVTMIVGLVAGLAVAGSLTWLAGFQFWLAYVGDVLAVARSEIRPQPGAPLETIIGAPAYIGGSLTLILGVIFLRQAGEARLGLLLLLLVPGFLYVTFQNFGNDPQWLILLAILVLGPKPAHELVNTWGWSLRRALSLTAVAAIAFAAPSFTNLAYSPFRHVNVNPERYTAFLPNSDRHDDLFGRLVRANRVDGVVGLDGPGSGLESRREFANRDATEALFNGERLPECELQLGIIAWFQTITDDLVARGYGGAKLFAADLFVSHWLFGDVERLQSGAPWYYGGLAGFDDADYVIIPLCPASLSVRAQILTSLEERGVLLAEVVRAPLYILAERVE